MRNDLVWLGALFNFACGHKVGGVPLVLFNPIRRLTLPKEKNIRRLVASEERYRRTLATQADARLRRRYA